MKNEFLNGCLASEQRWLGQLLVVAFLALVLTACGGSDDDAKPVDPQPPAEGEPSQPAPSQPEPPTPSAPQLRCAP